jgi:hypothetical protein
MKTAQQIFTEAGIKYSLDKLRQLCRKAVKESEFLEKVRKA